jgi:hypothetical protein
LLGFQFSAIVTLLEPKELTLLRVERLGEEVLRGRFMNSRAKFVWRGEGMGILISSSPWVLISKTMLALLRKTSKAASGRDHLCDHLRGDVYRSRNVGHEVGSTRHGVGEVVVAARAVVDAVLAVTSRKTRVTGVCGANLRRGYAMSCHETYSSGHHSFTKGSRPRHVVPLTTQAGKRSRGDRDHAAP